MAFEMYTDAEGIPYSDYGLYRGLQIGRQRSVLAVAERGLWYWNEYLRGEEPPLLLSYDWTKWPVNHDEFRPAGAAEAVRMMLACAEWMLDRIERRDGFAVWTYPYPFSYETGPGWRSAHAQAVGLQLLVRATKQTGDTRYIAPAGELLAAFLVDVRKGGISTPTEAGNLWFEKMADENNLQPKVLNGLLFAVLGLSDFAARTGLQQADVLADLGRQAAIEYLPKFDLGHWSAYDIHGKPASRHYHAIHIRQLAALADLNPVFAASRDRFQAYERSRDKQP